MAEAATTHLQLGDKLEILTGFWYIRDRIDYGIVELPSIATINATMVTINPIMWCLHVTGEMREDISHSIPEELNEEGLFGNPKVTDEMFIVCAFINKLKAISQEHYHDIKDCASFPENDEENGTLPERFERLSKMLICHTKTKLTEVAYIGYRYRNIAAIDHFAENDIMRVANLITALEVHNRSRDDLEFIINLLETHVYEVYRKHFVGSLILLTNDRILKYVRRHYQTSQQVVTHVVE